MDTRRKIYQPGRHVKTGRTLLNIAEVDFKENCVKVMFSEDNGIYPALMKICDEQIKIPMKRDFESLNVSVATGIILYEVIRQRG